MMHEKRLQGSARMTHGYMLHTHGIFPKKNGTHMVVTEGSPASWLIPLFIIFGRCY